MLVRAYVEAEDAWRAGLAAKELAARRGDAAATASDKEAGRGPLPQLSLLPPNEPDYRSRLEELGGVLFDEGEGAARGDEVPTFESFVAGGDAGGAGAESAAGAQDEPARFEWNAVTEPQHADASASFADLNELADNGVGGYE